MKHTAHLIALVILALGITNPVHAESVDELQGVWLSGEIEDPSGLIGTYRLCFEFVDGQTLTYTMIREGHPDLTTTVNYFATETRFAFLPIEGEDIKVMESSWEIDRDDRLIITPDDQDQPTLTFERVTE